MNSISAEGLTYAVCSSVEKNNQGTVDVSKFIFEGAPNAEDTSHLDLHLANPNLKFSQIESANISDNVIAKQNTIPFFDLYMPRFSLFNGDLKGLVIRRKWYIRRNSLKKMQDIVLELFPSDE